MSLCMTIPKLAQATGISEDTLRTWRANGWLRPFTQSGNRAYYRMEEFEAAAEAANACKAAIKRDEMTPSATMEEDARTYRQIAKQFGRDRRAEEELPPSIQRVRVNTNARGGLMKS